MPDKKSKGVRRKAEKTKPEPQKPDSVVVVGGGIAGMQAALDLANSQIRVYLVERGPGIGGRMAQLDKCFPSMDCAI